MRIIDPDRKERLQEIQTSLEIALLLRRTTGDCDLSPSGLDHYSRMAALRMHELHKEIWGMEVEP